MYRFNPEAYARGEEALTIDHAIPGPDNSGTNGKTPETASPTYGNSEPIKYVNEYINQEDRYIDLKMVSPTRAGILQPELQQDCDRENQALKDLT